MLPCRICWCTVHRLSSPPNHMVISTSIFTDQHSWSQKVTEIDWPGRRAEGAATLPNLQINLHSSTMCVKWQMLSTGFTWVWPIWSRSFQR
jgi:hypothetical protein